jgi:signal transduction histidine kinase
MSLNIGTHNFTALVPAIAEFVRRDAHREIRMHADVQGDTDHVVCDVHLMEAVLKNLLYNAARFARRDVRVTFVGHNAVNQLIVDDDGPGIPEKERKRVFESFVQLDSGEGRKAGFGLGLAIVKRTLEWHGGEVCIAQSPLGGARICATWPTSAARA